MTAPGWSWAPPSTCRPSRRWASRRRASATSTRSGSSRTRRSSGAGRSPARPRSTSRSRTSTSRSRRCRRSSTSACRDVVMSMLDKDPESRPRSGASLARILDGLLRDLQSEASRRTVPASARSHREELAAMPHTGECRRQRSSRGLRVARPSARPAAAAPGTPRRRASPAPAGRGIRAGTGCVGTSQAADEIDATPVRVRSSRRHGQLGTAIDGPRRTAARQPGRRPARPRSGAARAAAGGRPRLRHAPAPGAAATPAAGRHARPPPRAAPIGPDRVAGSGPRRRRRPELETPGRGGRAARSSAPVERSERTETTSATTVRRRRRDRAGRRVDPGSTMVKVAVVDAHAGRAGALARYACPGERHDSRRSVPWQSLGRARGGPRIRQEETDEWLTDTSRMLASRYEVGELIGRGGMAEVHIGRDTRLGRTVAIKVLRSDLARDPHVPGPVPPGGAVRGVAEPPGDRRRLRHR